MSTTEHGGTEVWAMLGRAIAERRAELGLRTQEALAIKAGVHINTINRLETGKPTRRNKTWPPIEAALQWPKGYIEDFIQSAGKLARTPLTEMEVRGLLREGSLKHLSSASVGEVREMEDWFIGKLRTAGWIPAAADDGDPGPPDGVE